MQRVVPMIAVLSAMSGYLVAGEAPVYQVTGPGGGGGIYSCNGSPVDPQFMLCCCDMGGCYRSEDGGKTWELIPYLQVMSSANESRPFFHGRDANIVVWRAWLTKDKGRTWKPVADTVQGPWGTFEQIGHVACSADAQPELYVGAATGVWVSTDEGQEWKQIITGACGGIQTLDDGTVYAVADGSLYQWKTGTANPRRLDAAGIDGSITAVAAAVRDTSSVVHVVAGGGILTSVDEGRTWQARPTAGGLVDVVMARNQLTTAYACDRQNVYVTRDSGETWNSTFHYGTNAPHTWIQKDISWGYYVTKTGLGCGQGRADTVTVASQAELYISNDAGETWEARHVRELGVMPDGPGTRNESVGLEVSSCWNYYLDPHDASRHYCCFSDFGLIRSVDGGKTWAWSARGCPWSNTFYALAFDPHVQGRIYAAASSVHEIIHWIACTPPKRPGGVCVSDDYGVTWRPLAGLPAVPCTSVVIDEKHSTPNASVIYASLWSKGVYKSIDSGKSWVPKPGVGRAGNLHTFKITVHPQTNDLYVNVSACREGGNRFPVAGGLWKSSDGGETWQELTEGQNIKWLNGYCVHPADPEIIFITGGTTPRDKQGGVYRTTDGGRNWHRVLDDSAFQEGFTQGLCVEMNPRHPDVMFFGSVFGSYISTDGGDTWKVAEDIPFRSCNNISFDPQDYRRAYIMSGGAGILKGPAPGLDAQ